MGVSLSALLFVLAFYSVYAVFLMLESRCWAGRDLEREEEGAGPSGICAGTFFGVRKLEERFRSGYRHSNSSGK